MVAKPHNDGGSRNRAGVPLARAQRLAAKADAQSQTKSSTFVPVALGAVILVSGVGVFLATSTTMPTQVSAAASSTPQIVVDEPAQEPTVAQVIAIKEASAASEVLEAVETAITAPRPRLAFCIEQIETRLRSLHFANNSGMAWDAKRERIRATAQSALNCELATVQFEGDIELASSDLADLRVRWDRATAILDLTIVDSVAPELYNVTFTDDGQPTEFLVH